MIATDTRLVGAGLKILSIINDDLGESAPTEFPNPKSQIQNPKCYYNWSASRPLSCSGA